MNSIAYIKVHLIELLQEQFKLNDEETKSISVKIEKSRGDMSCNAAFVIAKKNQTSPTKAAKQIVSVLTSAEIDDHENKLALHIQSASVAGAGFVNIALTEETWHTVAHEFAVHPKRCFEPFEDVPRHNYLIEFVSANPTGPLSIAHGRNGILGDVLANVLSFGGHKVTKEFYINDAGNQITNLGKSLKAKCLELLGKKSTEEKAQYDNEYLEKLAKLCIEENGEKTIVNNDQFFKDYAKNYFLKQIESDLTKYRINFHNWQSEQKLFDENKVSNALEELDKKNLTVEKEGATWFKASEFGDDKDRVLRKQDGNLTYVASDIAYHKDKFDRGYDFIIDILGQDHHSYTKRLFATMQALDYDISKLKIVLYQLVRMKQGEEVVRMSKRSGAFLSLSDVIDHVGADVARFFYLNRKAEAHLEMDLDLAMKKDMDNPVYYIQYAYVRINSILENASKHEVLADYAKKLIDKNLNEVDTKDLEHAFDEAEINLLKEVCALRDTFSTIAKTLQPHLLASQTIAIAKEFHSYYNARKVIDDSNYNISRSRLLIVDIVKNTLELCLDLLGLSKPDRM